jgi:bacteriocin biosynthesis cyclodehydratase domain-containing protein
MRRPRIKRTTEPFTAPDGDLILMRPSVEVDIRIERPSERDRSLLDALDGEHTVADLEAEFGAAEVSDTLAQLRELEALEDGADEDRLEPAEIARFDRQLRYFSDIGDELLTPSERQDRLREAKVAVLGVGGLGTWSAWALACCGVGEMWLIDGDRVEISNLNRQIFYTEADVGEHKVKVAAQRLRAFNSAMTVTATARRLESEAELADFIAGSDIVIDAADWPAHEIERWCNTACFEAGIPYITMSHFPPIARVGPLYVPGETGCFSCQEIAYRREYPLFDHVIEQRRALPSPAATLGPACGMIGGQVGMEVVHLLTGLAPPATLGVAHIYDLRTMEVKREQVPMEPECPVCAHLQPAGRVREVAGG